MEKSVEFELVVPCYNEAKNLPLLVRAAESAALSYGFTPDRFQLVLVENGSQDDSRLILSELKKTPSGAWFRVEALASNAGYGGGIWAGLQSSKAKVVGWTHADLQCDLKDAFRAYAMASLSTQTVVKGVRKGRGLGERVVSLGYALAVGLLWGFWQNELNAQPKVFHRFWLDDIFPPPKDLLFDAYILAQAKRLGLNTRTLPVVLNRRLHGESYWASSSWRRLRTFGGVIRSLQKTHISG